MLSKRLSLKALLRTPEKYEESELASVARALNVGLLLLSFFLIVVFTRQVLQRDYNMMMLIGLGIVVSFISRWLFLRGHLKKSTMMVAIFFTVLLTIICSFGNGIHDIGLIGFPILIGFSSILLDQKQLIISSVLSVLGLTWLVLGDRLSLFEPIPVPVGELGDFIIASLMITIGGLVAFSLTSNMKDSLKKANKEIDSSRNEALHLSDQIDQKEEIIEEIHKAVINSLGHIRHLIDHSPKETDELVKVYESLRRKILVIEAAHGILLTDKAPILLDIKELTKEILTKYEISLSTPVLQVDIDQASCIISLDQAIHYGIFFIELVHEVDHYPSDSFKITLTMQEDLIQLRIHGFENGHQEKLSIIMDLLSRQLKGKLRKSDREIILSFLPSTKK